MENEIVSTQSSLSTTNAKLAWRIGVDQWFENEQWGRIFQLIEKYRSAIDEIAFFMGDVRAWMVDPSLNNYRRQAEVLENRISELRSSGFNSICIDQWPTLGDDGAALYSKTNAVRKPLPFQPVVYQDGRSCGYAMCINVPEARTYLLEMFRIASRLNPDAIWVEDDFRYHAKGGRSRFTCFCPRCLSLFQNGLWYDRMSLTDALNDPIRGDLRIAWTEFVEASLAGMCAEIEKAVHAVNPNIVLGFMTVGAQQGTYSGFYARECLKSLNARKARPGCGAFYTDEHPRDLLIKAFDVGREIASFPDSVDDIQYEEETFPNIAINKSAQSLYNEVCVALGVGCTGVVLQQLPIVRSVLDVHKQNIALISESRGVLDAFAAASSGLVPHGLWPAYDMQLMAKRPVENGNWFVDCTWGGDPNVDPLYEVSLVQEWAELGFGFAYNPTVSSGTLLWGKIANVFSDDELIRILTGAVLMDTHALRILETRGLLKYTGVSVGEACIGGPAVSEVYVANSISSGYIGEQHLTLDQGVSLLPLSEHAVVLSHLLQNQADGHEKNCGACVTAFENELGGRVVVMGYSPWKRIGTVGKHAQLRSLVDWATRNTMPFMLDRPVRITPFIRMNDERTRFAAVLLNNGLGDTGSFSAEIRAHIKTVSILTPDGKNELPVESISGGIRITIDNMPAWSSVILIGH